MFKSILRKTTVIMTAAFVFIAYNAFAQQKGSKVKGDCIAVLGQGAGPVFRVDSNNTGFLLIVNGAYYMVDCGAGTPNQIFRVTGGFTPLKNLFFTHYHFDHYAGLADLMARAYQTRPASLTSLNVWGPPGLKKIIDGTMAGLETGHKMHNWNPQRPNLPPTPVVMEINLPKTGIQEIGKDENVKISATRAYHDVDVPDAYAYRFDILTGRSRGVSVVFSGDTVKNEQVIALAKDATFLVHEVGMNSLAEKIAPKTTALYKHLINSHTDVSEIPEIGKASNAGTIILHHYGNVSGDTPVADAAKLMLSEVLKANEKVGFKGKIIAPVELDVINLK